MFLIRIRVGAIFKLNINAQQKVTIYLPKVRICFSDFFLWKWLSYFATKVKMVDIDTFEDLSMEPNGGFIP